MSRAQSRASMEPRLRPRLDLTRERPEPPRGGSRVNAKKVARGRRGICVDAGPSPRSTRGGFAWARVDRREQRGGLAPTHRPVTNVRTRFAPAHPHRRTGLGRSCTDASASPIPPPGMEISQRRRASTLHLRPPIPVSRLRTSAIHLLDVERLDLVNQRAERHPQRPRRLGLVPPGRAQRVEDELRLVALELHLQIAKAV